MLTVTCWGRLGRIAKVRSVEALETLDLIGWSSASSLHLDRKDSDEEENQ